MSLTLSTFRREVYDEFFRILKYWETYSIDTQNGGFYGVVNDQNQPVADAPKAVVINSRILWTFSTAYIHFHKNEHLKIAQRAYEYIKNHFVDSKYGGVYWSVKADGTPLETKKQMYGNAFAVYGLSEYYRATKQKEALDLAVKIYQEIEKHSFDPVNKGYIEAFNQDWSQTDDYILCRGDSRKSMNTHLHLLEALTNLYRVWKDEAFKKQFKSMLEIVMNKIVDNQTYRMTLFFDEQWNHKSETISYGHDIEASWLIWEAAEVLHDKAIIVKARDLCLNMAKAACDGLGKDNGMNYEFEPSKNHLNDERSWWVMAEACVGFMNAYQMTKKVHYLEKSTQSWEFIKKHLLDLQKGEWFGGVKPDGTITMKNKITFWKCPYHNSRMCLEIWKRLG
jgi:mannobiose 2-epimerase